MPRDYALEQADRAGREDDRSFQECADEMKPHLSERETLLLELCEYLFAHAYPQYSDYATEQMRNIANTSPDKMRLAMIRLRDESESNTDFIRCNYIHDIATNALK